jgi:hypothetical protein
MDGSAIERGREAVEDATRGFYDSLGTCLFH